MVTELEERINRRQDRIEDAIERLTEISGDLNKMLAVQEQRLLQHEKNISAFEIIVEKRREEYDTKISSVYDTMRLEDQNIINKLEKMRGEQKDQHDDISKKITAMEKIIWTYLGGFSVIVFLMTYAPTIIKMLLN